MHQGHAETIIKKNTLACGLYLVATPIGAARDITLRALDILASADVLAAEDTRTLRHLMEIHGIALSQRPLIAYHEHNEGQALPRIITALKEGKSVAYASEAGTPLICDPGYGLTRAAIEEGLTVLAAPGPSAALCALTVSGLPTDKFYFAGFSPSSSSARQRYFENLATSDATLIFYESPKRIHKSLTQLVQTFGEQRPAALCRELTKRFEEIIRGSLSVIAQQIENTALKGEIVMVIDRAPPLKVSSAAIDEALERALETMSVKDASTAVAHALGLARREIYQRALQRGNK